MSYGDWRRDVARYIWIMRQTPSKTHTDKETRPLCLLGASVLWVEEV